MQFIDPQVEGKLAHPDQMPPQVVEGMRLAYKVRQQNLSRFERALLELLHMQADAARYRVQIEQLQHEQDRVDADGPRFGELLDKIARITHLAEQQERDVDRARTELIRSYAAEYRLEVKLDA